VLLAGFTAAVGTRVIPYVLDRVADTGSRELFTLAVLTIAMGIAVGSASVFGVSMALGAFLAGLVVGRSDYSLRAASDALPMRDAFAVLFFVAVGMLLSPQYVLDAPGVIIATLAVVMIGKPLVAIVIVRLLGYPFKVALSIAVALSQIGEFSFILSSLGRELGILPVEATHTVVAASIVSIVLNPILYRAVPHVDRWAATHPRLWKLLNPPLREDAPAHAWNEGPFRAGAPSSSATVPLAAPSSAFFATTASNPRSSSSIWTRYAGFATKAATPCMAMQPSRTPSKRRGSRMPRG
jgi:CPA2 family monovalent cation:H+ antiporter-2